MIQLVDDGYHNIIVRLSGPVIILFSNSNSFYMDMLCVCVAQLVECGEAVYKCPV